MPDATKMTRRDWFRLRKLHPPPTRSQETTVGDDTIGLASIEHPPNYDGMDLSQLPPMREAILTPQQVQDLFADIAEVATDVLLMQRSSSASRATASKAETSQSLMIARNALLAKDLPRIQIRYRWQDRLWIDTLELKPEGYRIVRIAHPA